jgi:hypothetical protein
MASLERSYISATFTDDFRTLKIARGVYLRVSGSEAQILARVLIAKILLGLCTRHTRAGLHMYIRQFVTNTLVT